MDITHDINHNISSGKSEVNTSTQNSPQISARSTPKNIRSPFVWDGSYIGLISEQQILNRCGTCGKFEYWIFYYKGYTSACMIRFSKYYTQCLVDELKPLFGLNKIGTHYAYYKDKYAILLRARVDLSGK